MLSLALTEIALQLKGGLAFLLGLGGMFTSVKGMLIGIIVLPKIGADRPSVSTAAAALRKQLIILAVVSLLLLTTAVCIYFSSAMSSIDPDVLRKSKGILDGPQQICIGLLTFIALTLVVIESWNSVLRYRFDLLSKIK